MKSNNDSSNIKRWELPTVGERKRIPVKVHKKKPEIPVKTTAEIEESAKSEGFAAGYAEGMAHAQRDIKQLAEEFQNILHILQTPLLMIDNQIEQKLLELTLAVSKHLLCYELSVSPERVFDIVKEVVKAIPAHSKNTTLYLHPDDCVLFKECVEHADKSEQEFLRSLQVLADVSLQRGECRFDTESIQLDATFDSRAREIIEHLLYVNETSTEAANETSTENPDMSKPHD